MGGGGGGQGWEGGGGGLITTKLCPNEIQDSRFKMVY